jgi:rubredoxin
MASTVFINFRGGIISPGTLLHIMEAAESVKVLQVRFGLRQQLLIDMEGYSLSTFTALLDKVQVPYELDAEASHNIISSYPAEEVFIRDTWLSEGEYKDILSSIDHKPLVKINICDSNQSFTPLLTGNINWIASPSAAHYWHLLIRFPKTNAVFEWDQLCYTNDIGKATKAVEQLMTDFSSLSTGNADPDGELLFEMLQIEHLILQPAEQPLVLPAFNLPYYEGLNRYDNKYWLGVYRRDELFSVAFLKKLAQLCLDTRIGQICCTSWKTIMIKGIEEKDKGAWNMLLEEFQINMRHAANELNFQVEDNSAEGLHLKNYLVKHLSIDDTRTFGICIGIKTRKKSEVFSSILVRRRYLLELGRIRLFRVFDILCAKDFNPNERTEEIFSRGNPRMLLPEQLRRAILKYYQYRAAALKNELPDELDTAKPKEIKKEEWIYQCGDCLTVYDPVLGDPDNQVPANTAFEELSAGYTCAVCEAKKENFSRIPKAALAS